MDDLTRYMVEEYAARRDPNRWALRAPIDIFDIAKLALEQNKEIEELKGKLAEIESAAAYAATHGVQNDGTQP